MLGVVRRISFYTSTGVAHNRSMLSAIALEFEQALILSDSDLEDLAQELEALESTIRDSPKGANLDFEFQRVDEIVRTVELSQKTICSTQQVIQLF